MVLFLRVVVGTLLSLCATSTLATHHKGDVFHKRQLDANHKFPDSLTTGNHSTACYSTQQLYSMTRAFCESFLFPNNQKQADSINSTIFTEDILGRVDATRNFVGRKLNTEYIYGLFAGIRDNPNPNFFTFLGWPSQYRISHWAGTGDVASFSVITDLNIKLVNVTVPFEINVWLTFNDRHQISQYDATFRYLQWSFDSLTQQGMALFKISNATEFQGLLTQKLVTSVCSVAQGSCNGTNQQYSSTDECIDFLTTQIRFGQAYELGMDTLLCRMIHQGMVPLDPDTHCSHIGKTGGAYCVDDRKYAQVVMQPYFTKQSFVGAGLPGSGEL